MSAGGMPELGSKISLISKADIRYEGRLFTVDPQECTIALANVRSFGTEDRDTQYPIAPQSQIYDYILFRGTDIKDIRVVNNGMPHPNDPAIMQMQLPNGQHLMPPFPMPAAMNPPIGNAYPFAGIGNLSGIGNSGGSSGVPSGLAPGSFMMNQKPKQQTSLIDLIAGGSRSTTPVSLISRKSPSADMGLQVNQHHNQQQHHQNSGRDAGHKRQQQQQQRGGGGMGRNDDYRGNQQHHDRRDSGRMDFHNNQHDNRSQNQRNNHGNNNNNRGWVNRGGNNNNNMMRNQRGGRGSIPNRNFFPQGGGYRQPTGNMMNKTGRPAKNTIKFEQDYDFEQANNKFEELRSQFTKLKVGDVETKTPTEQVNGETDTKKDDSGNETGAGEHEQEEEDVTVGYDKTKSFFDNISCEAATDRTKAKRNDWRQERKLNSETFGISSTRRGGYRGRGGGGGGGGGAYYNRANMNSGNYNRGYRSNNYQNNRGRNNNNNNNRMAHNGSSSKNQQSTSQSQPAAVAAGGK